MLRPKMTDSLDYEAELVVIIGKRVKHLTMDNAYSCIAGYSCFNDGSVREFQRRTTQWDMGKNFDKTGGFGPWMISADEVPAGGKGLKIESRLNGKVMQSDNTSNMMFPIAETLVDISQGMTLEPGDIVVTGTPSGVGFARKPPVFLKPGDRMEVLIEGIGGLGNPVVSESDQ
jgi:2-keto-4-pentenoate hydratase/2-oxohepta-3-ene-1,7-dioic acid hydratase in catechol pathway